MFLDVPIYLAALGITTLELTEAAAVGLALYADSRNYSAFLYVALGVITVLIPTILVGEVIRLLPEVYILLIGGVLLTYFGQRLIKSARRSVYFSRKGSSKTDTFEKGLMVTGFSVGAIEAFEAAIVLVGLLPISFSSSIGGLGTGITIVIVATYILRNQVRKIKQAIMKIVVSSLLMSFASLWFGELIWDLFSLGRLSDLVLIPLLLFWFAIIYWFANRPFPELGESAKSQARLFIK